MSSAVAPRVQSRAVEHATSRAAEHLHGPEGLPRAGFSFGRNWEDYLRRALTPERVEHATRRTCALLGLERLDGLSFLDVGCGSGLFSLVAHRLGAARVLSFDVDERSVACCRELRARAGEPAGWEVARGSILDAAFVAALPRCDVVYAWGVLHHTGDLWGAIEAAASRVAPGGLFALAVYNRVEHSFLGALRGSRGALLLKRAYRGGGWAGRRAIEACWVCRDVVKWLVRLRNPLVEIRHYAEQRGMSWWHDVRDWLGGYPYECASAGELFEYCHGRCGLRLERMRSVSTLACHELLFSRPRGGAAGPV